VQRSTVMNEVGATNMKHSDHHPSDQKPSLPDDIRKSLIQSGFVFATGEEMKSAFTPQELESWPHFAESWNHLGLDRYMADGGRYRRRRYGVFSLHDGHITAKQHQPHYQSRDYNTLNGGVQRWFSPVEEATGRNPLLLKILGHLYHLATILTPDAAQPEKWHAEMHQFRIEVAEEGTGNPTPEGLHRDGVDWVWVMMVARQNVAEGVTSIHDLSKNEVGRFTLRNPLDSAFVDDHRVYHGVTPITRVDPSAPGHRDVLVVTIRRA